MRFSWAAISPSDVITRCRGSSATDSASHFTWSQQRCAEQSTGSVAPPAANGSCRHAIRLRRVRCSAGPWCEPAKSGYTTIACVAPDPGAWAFALSSLVNGLSTAIVDPLKEHLLTDESATRAVTAMPVTDDRSKPAEVADAATSAAADVASTATVGRQGRRR